LNFRGRSNSLEEIPWKVAELHETKEYLGSGFNPKHATTTIMYYIQLGGTKVNLDPVTSDGDITTTAFLDGNPRTAKAWQGTL